MKPFSFSGMTAISFGLDRIKQLADDITALNGSRTPVSSLPPTRTPSARFPTALGSRTVTAAIA